MNRSHVAVRAIGWSIAVSVAPLVPVAVGTLAERETLAVACGAVGVLLAALMVPIAILLTATSLRIPKPWRSVPWLGTTLAPLLLAGMCFVLAGPQRHLRLWWEPDAVDAALDALFVLGSGAVLGGIARRRTGRWSRLALAWMFVGGLVWVGVRFTTPHTDVIGDGLFHTLLLFPVWTLTLAPSFALWVFP